jgi:hypothetical protein
MGKDFRELSVQKYSSVLGWILVRGEWFVRGSFAMAAIKLLVIKRQIGAG